MQGNEALGEGVVRAGCQLYAGYPITPQNELTEYLSWRMPEEGRIFIQAERELARAQEALQHTHLFAPWTAIVLSVDVAPEANIGAGAPVVTLLNIKDGLRFVTQDLSEQHIADIYPGHRAVVTLRTFAQTPVEGSVEAVVPQINQASNTGAHFTVHVRLAPTDLRLLPGLTGRVEIFAGD